MKGDEQVYGETLTQQPIGLNKQQINMLDYTLTRVSTAFFSNEFTAIRSTRTIGQPTIPPPSSPRTLRASWVSASISRSVIRTCFISTRARSSSIACYLMLASAMNIAWSRARTTLALR